MKKFLLLFTLIPLVFAMVQASDLAVGETFPDLVLPTLDGDAASIHDFRGQKLMLHLWASW